MKSFNERPVLVEQSILGFVLSKAYVLNNSSRPALVVIWHCWWFGIIEFKIHALCSAQFPGNLDKNGIVGLHDACNRFHLSHYTILSQLRFRQWFLNAGLGVTTTAVERSASPNPRRHVRSPRATFPWCRPGCCFALEVVPDTSMTFPSRPATR